jgi:hypothetical protein
VNEAPVNAALAAAIEAVVERSYAQLERLIEDGGGEPLALKYVPSRWAKHYAVPGRPLKVSQTAGFTWGTGTYVAPLAYPISSAIFGRVGVVARYDPSSWRVFDATDSWAQQLYVDWIRTQPHYGQLVLTLHSQLANKKLRDSFRERFRIDCVLFHPDQLNLDYTDSADVWMNVTDWLSPGTLETGMSARLTDARFTVLVEEEFEPDEHDVMRSTLIGPLTPRMPNTTLASAIAGAYAAGTLVKLSA